MNRATVGGVAALSVTGALAASVFMATGDWTVALTGGLLLVITLVGGVLLARFVARHGSEIGEARFDTTNKSSNNG